MSTEPFRVAPTSIYKRVIVPFSVALLVATALAYLIATFLLTRSLEARLESSMQMTLTFLTGSTVPLTLDLLNQVSALQDTQFVLFDRVGEVALSTLDLAAQPQRLREGVVSAQREAITGAQAPYFRDSGQGYMLGAVLLPEGRSQQYLSVVAIAPTTHVAVASRNVALTLGGVALVTLLLLALWSHRLSLNLTRPLEALVGLAEGVAAGQRKFEPIETDITELASLVDALADMNQALLLSEQALSQTQRLKGLGELAAQVAHEIRNPLTAIKLNIQMLQDDLAGNNAGRRSDALSPLLQEIQRLELIVSTTLSLARPIELNRERDDLSEVVTEVLELMRPQLEHRGIALTANTAEPVRADIDSDRIKQVIYNLLNNAAQALIEGGQIAVTTRTTPGGVTLIVEDNGPGIDPSQVASLFNSAGESPSGLGIGLMICKQIVDLHHGDILYQSSDALGGACFRIDLPVEPAG